MQFKMRISLLFVFITGMLSISAISPDAEIYNPRFSAYIMQDGKRLEINQHVVQVKRKTFNVVVDMPDQNGVFVSVAFNHKTFKNALKNIPAEHLPGFSNSAMSEKWLNQNNELMVSDFSPNYWFIDSRLEHRFTDYEIINDRYWCYRTVDILYDADVKKQRELSKVEMPLYLTFITFSKDGDNSRANELMRHEFKIEWVD